MLTRLKRIDSPYAWHLPTAMLRPCCTNTNIPGLSYVISEAKSDWRALRTSTRCHYTGFGINELVGCRSVGWITEAEVLLGRK
ncbi:hypothetical protein PILCRDRAFT_739004 [Piloderma croceum F 1598]|uniref:Uncharacterized protein n=1 Tax=Piloderma croceum (strain F 1598) TaxID=765440 RepID=A0A0C3B5U3_PILCF|nr:hypothetical protein PILCRDRAFT_739004 [Piloderma croceum F 1598]